MEHNSSPGPLVREGRFPTALSSRRKFLRYAGYSGLAAAVLAGCTKIIPNAKVAGTGTGTGTGTGPVTTGDPANVVSLGVGDIGLLNYIYALEQLEAAFYTQAMASPYENIPSLELSRLTDIRDHEIAHRELFSAWLNTRSIQPLTFNFSSVDFSVRHDVLFFARTMEDIGVSAYNGVNSLFTVLEYLQICSKVNSVEARHSAYIRNLTGPGSFADRGVVDEQGLDISQTPAAVVALIQPYINQQLDASQLPTS